MNDHAHERRHAPIPWHPMSEEQLTAERKAAAAICVIASQASRAAKKDGNQHLYHIARVALEDGLHLWREFTDAGGVRL